MSLSDEERHAIVLYRIEKANAASALLIHDGHKVGTHKGVIALFNLKYVKEGPLSR